MKRSLGFAWALGVATIGATVGPVTAQEPWRSSPDLPGTSRKAIRIPDVGTLRFPVRNDWTINATALSGDPIVVQLTQPPGSATPFEVQVRIETTAEAEVFSLRALRKNVKRVRDVMATTATTREIPLQELRGDALSGYYFSATDRSRSPRGGWRYMTYGSALMDDVVLTFSLYSNTSSGHQVGPTLDMMKRMEREPLTPGEAAEARARAAANAQRWATIQLDRNTEDLPLAMALPDKGWALWMDLPGFHLQGAKVAADQSSAQMRASDPRTRVGLSAYIEQQRKQRTVAGCRSHFTGRMASPFTKREEERDGIILVTYDDPRYEGSESHERHTHALLYRDGTCIDVHISKPDYVPGDERLFDDVLDSIKFVKKQRVPVPSGP